jgi:phosphoribosylformylglycinamidine synthase
VPGENPSPPLGDAAPAVTSDAQPIADVPVGSLGDGPLYHRPIARPAEQDALNAADPALQLRDKFPPGADLSGELLALLATPTIADKTWVSRQYDHQLFLNTVVGPGGDAAVLRVKGTTKALAMATDGKARFCRLDPRTGGRLVVLEAARNVACSGARAIALVNCLNFGNPEHPEVMWQFSEVVEGMSEACEALGIPVIGGNVSFYNASGGDDIHPTPVAGVIGLIDELDAVPPAPRLRAGDDVVVIGEIRPELGGSEWAAVVHGLDGGLPPTADLERAQAVHSLVAGLVAEHLVAGVHDLSDGGLAVALAEMAVAGEVGCKVELIFDGCSPAEACFAEPASVVVCSVDRENTAAVCGLAAAAGVPVRVIGVATGSRLIAKGAFDVALEDTTRAWRDTLPALMSHDR